MPNKVEDPYDCRLCEEIDYFEESLFAAQYPDVANSNALFVTTRLQAMLPIGPFCDGHLLVVSKEHAPSFAHLGHSISSELNSFIDAIVRLTSDRYGRTIVFEHGAMSMTRRGGCCLVHAHMNVMPIPESLKLVDLMSKYAHFSPAQLGELIQFVDRDQPYLFFRCGQEGSYAASAPKGSSQLFRKAIASSIPGKMWDWRDHPQAAIVRKMAKQYEDGNLRL